MIPKIGVVRHCSALKRLSLAAAAPGLPSINSPNRPRLALISSLCWSASFAGSAKTGAVMEGMAAPTGTLAIDSATCSISICWACPITPVQCWTSSSDGISNVTPPFEEP